jgi:hypothetical protein
MVAHRSVQAFLFDPRQAGWSSAARTAFPPLPTIDAGTKFLVVASRNEVTVGPKRRKVDFSHANSFRRDLEDRPLIALTTRWIPNRGSTSIKRWTWSGMTSVSTKMLSVSSATSALICLTASRRH